MKIMDNSYKVFSFNVLFFSIKFKDIKHLLEVQNWDIYCDENAIV